MSSAGLSLELIAAPFFDKGSGASDVVGYPESTHDVTPFLFCFLSFGLLVYENTRTMSITVCIFCLILTALGKIIM